MIDNTLQTNTAEQRQFIRNLGAHEFGHVLGLADDPQASVMNVEIGSGNRPFSDRDRQEITALYGRRTARLPQEITALATSLSSVPRGRIELRRFERGRYDYHISFEGITGELIDVITLFVNPSLVTGALAPDGWLFMDPIDVQLLGPDAPYFRDYMVDGTDIPAPWETLTYLAFRSPSLPADLRTERPELDFTIFTKNDTVGSIAAIAGGDIQSITGPVAIVP
jgi:hypothetical protein